MQRQPTSMFLVTEAYRQELLADGERVRSKLPAGTRQLRTPGPIAGSRESLGHLLIRLGEWLRDSLPADSLERHATSAATSSQHPR